MTGPNVLMIFPRFNQNSFWSLQATCDMYGARCPAPPLGMLTLAALLPQHWNIRLVNRNVSDVSTADLEWAGMVMTGGMLPQRPDTLTVIDLCHAHGKPVVVGGPDAMSDPDVYQEADFRVLGEAEGIIGQFVDAWNAGAKSGVFEAKRFSVDITSSPIPRYDLLDFKDYLFVGVQFSRGCPFTCEFCDIIELYGRVPRSKTNAQMLAELQTLYDLGYRGHVDFVDDNLIGNKKALKLFLPLLASWQRERGYPFYFSTEASLNLGDDRQLLGMMKEANFFLIFVGVESPDTDTLVATQKKQNTRRSLAGSVHRIYDAGMVVIAGFIIGFDTEKGSIASGMISCIEDTSIPVCMVGLLTALPNTQLTRRLMGEERLLPFEALDLPDQGDQCTAGLNFITLRPRKQILLDYKKVIQEIYEPESFFKRVRDVGRALKRPRLPVSFNARLALHELSFLVKLMWHMTVRMPRYRKAFWGTIFDTARHNPRALESVIALIAFYVHLGTFGQYLVRDIDRKIDVLERQAETEVPPKTRLAAA